MKKKAEGILQNFFNSLPLDSHREYVGTVEVDHGTADLNVLYGLIIGYIITGLNVDFSLVGVIVAFLVIHIGNFLVWRAEPLHHKAMRYRSND